MTTQLVLGSSLFACVGAAAAIDAGLLGDPDRRILLQSSSALAPELVSLPTEITGADQILTRFDRTITLNDLLAPLHPHSFTPARHELAVWQRLLRRYWDLGDGPVELVLESLAVNPSHWLAGVFHDSPITVISDGLMSYGPTRNRLPLGVGQRLDALVHLDLVPGLSPMLLREFAVPCVAVPNESVIKVFRRMVDARACPDRVRVDGVPTAVVLGQYLSALGLLTPAEEANLQADLVGAAIGRGARRILFKPHPASPQASLGPVTAAARSAGVELIMVDDPAPAEVLIAQIRPMAVVASFSTALVTAGTLFDAPVIAVGTELLLERMTPYQNSNRIPVTIIDALTRPHSPYAGPHGVQPLVDAVSYCMQPNLLAELREPAHAFWATRSAAERARYVSRGRLSQLGLPGGVPIRPSVRRAARRGVRSVMASSVLAPLERRTRRTSWRRRMARWAGN